MAVTLQNIAEVTGVSPKTVSAILGSRAHLYRPGTRERVQNAARELGYRPNLAARSTRTGRFHGVSLLYTAEPDRAVMPPDQLVKLLTELERHGQRLTFSRVPEDYSDGDEVPQALAESMCDGFLINFSRKPSRELNRLLQRVNAPRVWLNTEHEFDCVRPDDRSATRDAVARLARLGHRRVWYAQFSYPMDDRHFSADYRREAFEAAAADFGLSMRILDTDRIAPEDRLDAAIRWLSEADPRPTAIYCYGDEATAFLHAAERLGRRVPDDLSLVAAGTHTKGHLDSFIAGPRHDFDALARAAVEMLLAKIDRHCDEASAADEPLPVVEVPMSMYCGPSLSSPPC